MLHAVVIALALAAEPAWELSGETATGVRWYTRAREGSALRELLATGVIDAPPGDVWAVLLDFEGYTRTMPSTVKAKVLAAEGAVHWVYTRYDLPLVAPRDTIARMVSRADEAAGVWLLTWAAVSDLDALVPAADGVVRLRTNEGRWRLESRDGRSTRVTYQLFTDPGGDLPPFILNQFNGMGVPLTFDSLQKAAAARWAARAAAATR